MYLPRQFETADARIARELMRAHPFASLVSTDDTGLPFVTHLPLHLSEPAEEGGGEQGEPRLVLLGHCAKPNPHWRYLRERPRALVTFLGPHAYLSPRVYPDLRRVPSWNYVAVHCTVQATLVEEDEAKDRLLKQLIGDHEPAYAAQWRTLDTEFQHKLLAGIVGFELQVVDLQCKLKLNQHRPEAHATMKAGYAQGSEDERALARWMDRLQMAN